MPPKLPELNENKNECHENYMTPWATVIAMFALYMIALLWFCRREFLILKHDNIFVS